VRRTFVALVFVLSACSGSEVPEARPEPPVGPGTTTVTTPRLPEVVESSAPLVELHAVEVASGLERPSYAIAPWGDDRLFVLEQPGRIRIVDDSGLQGESFLDIAAQVGSDGLEQGLLGMAFHPAFPADDRFFVYFTDRDGDSRLMSYRLGADPGVADPESGEVILRVDQPASNHNGGMVGFGLDGYLYLGLGDGGGANDQFGHGQDPSTLLGTILRIDVDAATPYAVPPDNPLLGTLAPEVWAFGLRNPWRFDIDPATGDVYIADVGQSQREEVTVLPAGTSGSNLGWSVTEGRECFGSATCDTEGLVAPTVTYGHDEGCSVTGGFVYRGSAIPELAGHYLYSDWCSGWVRSLRIDGVAAVDQADWMDGVAAVDQADWTGGVGDVGRVSSFGRDGHGELYLVATEGSVWRIEPVRE